MATKKVEELAKNDDIVLWSGPAVGEVTALVKRTRVYEQIGVVEFALDEMPWATLWAPIGTEVELAD